MTVTTFLPADEFSTVSTDLSPLGQVIEAWREYWQASVRTDAGIQIPKRSRRAAQVPGNGHD